MAQMGDVRRAQDLTAWIAMGLHLVARCRHGLDVDGRLLLGFLLRNACEPNASSEALNNEYSISVYSIDQVINMSVNNISPNGSKQSVELAQDELEKSLNIYAHRQMVLVENQARTQLIQANLSHRADLMNSAKQLSSKIQL